MDEHLFAGTLTYADAHTMEYAIDRFLRTKAILTPLACLAFDGLSVTVEFRTIGAEPAWFCGEFEVLARHAVGGQIAVSDPNGRIVARVGYGGKTAARRPARHRRWELFAGATSVAALRTLAAEGADMEQRIGPLGVTPLHIAARAGAEEAVAFLLEAGVAVDALTTECTTPLAFASTAAVARRLIAAGADLNRVLDGGIALVVNSARLERGEVVRELVRAGARIPAGTHADIAKALALCDELELLRELATSDEAFRAALAHDDVVNATIQTDGEVALDVLLSFGADLPADFLGRAAAFGARRMLRLALGAPDALASAGPSSNDRDAMCLAAAYGRLDAMQLPADAGVPVEPAEPGATSPLAWSVWSAALAPQACIATATWLLDRGASINAVNARGKPALAFAIERTSRHGAAFLVERGADLGLLSATARRSLAGLLPDDLAARVRAFTSRQRVADRKHHT
jgi:hypothetical protein